MFIDLDFESEQPIYLQIIHQIIGGMAKGELQPGEPLPSVRALAADIGVNLHTVNKAYQQLKQDAYIVIHRRKGVMVNPEGPPPADEQFILTLEEGISPKIAEAACRNMTEKELLDAISEIYNKYRRETK